MLQHFLTGVVVDSLIQPYLSLSSLKLSRRPADSLSLCTFIIKRKHTQRQAGGPSQNSAHTYTQVYNLKYVGIEEEEEEEVLLLLLLDASTLLTARRALRMQTKVLYFTIFNWVINTRSVQWGSEGGRESSCYLVWFGLVGYCIWRTEVTNQDH